MKKELPINDAAEQGLIASVLMDSEVLNNIEVNVDWFHRIKNKKIWKLIEDVSNTHESWDAIIFAEYLKKHNKLNEVGGYDYLNEINNSVTTQFHSQFFANELKEAFELRKEIETLSNALDKAYAGESTADDVISELMKKPIERVFDKDSIFKEWKQAQSGQKSSIPTPYASVDRFTGGIKPGMVTIFTGRSKSGKSMFLAHWYNYLGQLNIPILSVPLEDKREITLKRMAANFGGYNNSELDAGGRYITYDGQWVWDPIKDKDLQRGIDCINHVSTYPVYFYDRKCTPKQLRGVAIRYKKKYDIQAMFVDGAKDLLRPSGKYGDVGFDEEISQQLCAIAEELDIAVIAVHHLTKLSLEERITVNHIRGSGNIVSDSRAVYALQSSGIEAALISQNIKIEYDEEGKLNMRVFECLSNNHGGTASKTLEVDLSVCKFNEAIKIVDKDQK